MKHSHSRWRRGRPGGHATPTQARPSATACLTGGGFYCEAVTLQVGALQPPLDTDDLPPRLRADMSFARSGDPIRGIEGTSLMRRCWCARWAY